MILTPGLIYDVDEQASLFVGWTEGDGSPTKGYISWDFFDEHGAYRGPNIHGIEPIFYNRQ